MSDKRTYTIPPQDSAEDTSNWDDRAFAIMRPGVGVNGKPLPGLALMRPSLEDNPFFEEITDKKSMTSESDSANLSV